MHLFHKLFSKAVKLTVSFDWSSVLDDEDSTITAGSIVTVTVTLKRQSMADLFDKEHIEPDQPVEEDAKMEEVEEDTNQVWHQLMNIHHSFTS